MVDDFVYGPDDVLRLLDELVAAGDGQRWNTLFADRAQPCPFLVDWPDENLVEWFDTDRLTAGRVLELGCGHGRNAVFMAGRGCRVDAIDLSAEALAWAGERAATADAQIDFQLGSIFEVAIDDAAYDLVYDSGCFHHIAPHRRHDYVELVHRALRPGGHFGLVCFTPEGGSGLTDRQVYQQLSLGGGLGYTEEQLRRLWDDGPFTTDVLRRMRRTNGHNGQFGEDFLHTVLATKRPAV